jgi:hypothetical protein
MRKTLRVSCLVLLLTCSASAGIMQNGSPELPPPAPALQEPTTSGIMPNDAADSLTQIALDLLAALPSLL